jgi:hypothetical protein
MPARCPYHHHRTDTIPHRLFGSARVAPRLVWPAPVARLTVLVSAKLQGRPGHAELNHCGRYRRARAETGVKQNPGSKDLREIEESGEP